MMIDAMLHPLNYIYTLNSYWWGRLGVEVDGMCKRTITLCRLTNGRVLRQWYCWNWNPLRCRIPHSLNDCGIVVIDHLAGWDKMHRILASVRSMTPDRLYCSVHIPLVDHLKWAEEKVIYEYKWDKRKETQNETKDN